VLLIKYDRQFNPHIGFCQGEIVGNVDRNLHDLRYSGSQKSEVCPMPYALFPMPYSLFPVVPHLSEKGYTF
jgi:hypothetical protein